MNLFFVVIISHSITSFIVESELFSTFRLMTMLIHPILHKLVTCMFCTGFWVGLSLSFLYIPFTFNNSYLNNILFAFFLANTTWFIHIIEKRITHGI